jgi:hypothetical protein
MYEIGILGLIIDAFGDLREQLDSVKETLEVIKRFLLFCLFLLNIYILVQMFYLWNWSRLF